MRPSCSDAGRALLAAALLTVGPAVARAGDVPSTPVQRARVLPGLLAGGPELVFVLPQWIEESPSAVRMFSVGEGDPAGLRVGRRIRLNALVRNATFGNEWQGALATSHGHFRFGAALRQEDQQEETEFLFLEPVRSEFSRSSLARTEWAVGAGLRASRLAVDVAVAITRERRSLAEERDDRNFLGSLNVERLRAGRDWVPSFVGLSTLEVGARSRLRLSTRWEDLETSIDRRAAIARDDETRLLRRRFQAEGRAWEVGLAWERGTEDTWTAWSWFRRSRATDLGDERTDRDDWHTGLSTSRTIAGALRLHAGFRVEMLDQDRRVVTPEEETHTSEFRWGTTFGWGVSRRFGPARLDVALWPNVLNSGGVFSTQVTIEP